MSAMRVAVVLAVLASAAAQGAVAGAEDAVDGVPCEPQLADCWADVAGHADCLLNPRNPRTRECRRANSTELCRAFEDALRCASDLPDNGCALRAGRRGFDFWIRGLEAVNTKLCFEKLMDNVVAHAECWDAMNWARCVQHAVPGLTHVVDLVDVLAPRQQHGQHGQQGQQGDAGHQCHAAMLRVAKCASTSAALDPPPEPCLQSPPVDLINEVLAAYFSASECGGNLAACPPPHHHQQEEALAATATTPAPTEPPPTAAAAPSAAAEDGDRSDHRSDHLPAAASAGASAASPAHLRAAPAHAGALALAVIVALVLSIKFV